eukprot:NODE_5_length_72347_cov_1.339331.p29 type:complete len:299 gc:universal NODE_5_length_72347_cov_1.339331:51349-50453(-)
MFVLLLLSLLFGSPRANPEAEDYFERLGLPRTANRQDVKRAYRKLAVEYHPDKNREKDTTSDFTNIGEAYGVLYDDEKREKYKRFGKEGLNQQQDSQNPFDIFKHFFQGNMQQQQNSGPDITMDLWVSLKDVLKGKHIKIAVASATFKSRVLQHEVFEFDLPSGVKDGTQFVKENVLPDLNARNRYAFAVDDDNEEILPGDIKFRVRVAEDASFKREGENLRFVQHLGLKHALLGFEHDFEHIDGSTLRLKRSGVTHSGFIQTFKGKGLGGDLYVEYQVVLPTKLSSDQKKLISQAFE